MVKMWRIKALVGMQKGAGAGASFQKFRHRIVLRLRNFTPRYLPQRTETWSHKCS